MKPLFMLLGRAWSGLRRERGAATAEYALLLALVVIILISTLSRLGQVLNTKILDIVQQLEAAQ